MLMSRCRRRNGDWTCTRAFALEQALWTTRAPRERIVVTRRKAGKLSDDVDLRDRDEEAPSGRSNAARVAERADWGNHGSRRRDMEFNYQKSAGGKCLRLAAMLGSRRSPMPITKRDRRSISVDCFAMNPPGRPHWAVGDPK